MIILPSSTPINQVVIGQGVISSGNNTVTFPSNLKTFPHGTEVNFSTANGGCIYPVSSSIRWKDNVEDICNKIDTSKLYDLRPVTFNPAIDNKNPDGDKDELCMGLIAEEVERYFPVLVPKDEKGRPSSVRYSLLSVVILEEMKKLKKELDFLSKQIRL